MSLSRMASASVGSPMVSCQCLVRNHKANRHENKLEQWRKNYNEIRPHSALGGMPPSEYAKALTEKAERPTLILSTA